MLLNFRISWLVWLERRRPTVAPWRMQLIESVTAWVGNALWVGMTYTRQIRDMSHARLLDIMKQSHSDCMNVDLLKNIICLEHISGIWLIKEQWAKPIETLSAGTEISSLGPNCFDLCTSWMWHFQMCMHAYVVYIYRHTLLLLINKNIWVWITLLYARVARYLSVAQHVGLPVWAPLHTFPPQTSLPHRAQWACKGRICVQ